MSFEQVGKGTVFCKVENVGILDSHQPTMLNHTYKEILSWLSGGQ